MTSSLGLWNPYTRSSSGEAYRSSCKSTPVSVVLQDIYERFKISWTKLKKTTVRLTCFLGRLPVLGELNLKVTYEETTVSGKLIVLGCAGPSLCVGK